MFEKLRFVIRQTARTTISYCFFKVESSEFGLDYSFHLIHYQKYKKVGMTALAYPYLIDNDYHCQLSWRLPLIPERSINLTHFVSLSFVLFLKAISFKSSLSLVKKILFRRLLQTFDSQITLLLVTIFLHKFVQNDQASDWLLSGLSQYGDLKLYLCSILLVRSINFVINTSMNVEMFIFYNKSDSENIYGRN